MYFLIKSILNYVENDLIWPGWLGESKNNLDNR
jgi:hypothetical protein